MKFLILLERCSASAYASVLSGMRGLSEKGIDLLMGLIMGGEQRSESTKDESSEKINLDMEKIKSMSDEQRMNLYNTIIESVMGSDRK